MDATRSFSLHFFSIEKQNFHTVTFGVHPVISCVSSVTDIEIDSDLLHL